jgi:2-alkenal reductase
VRGGPGRLRILTAVVRTRPAAAVLLLALGAALGSSGCGGKSGQNTVAAAGTSTTVRTTRVEVVTGLGKGGGFDPAAIYRRESPGVVTVVSVFGGAGGGGGLGSGFVISPSGEVLTNAHVVTQGQGSALRRASEVYVQFSDRNSVPAKIVGADPNADVALLQVDPVGLTLAPLPLGSSARLTVGAPVAAIGSPFGEPQSLSVGVVSAVDRTIDSLTNFQISGAIQTDAAINRGNSGGPLVDAKGRVVGINSQIRTTNGGSVGVGFAIPIDVVKRSLAQLRSDGKVRYAYIGVSTVPMFPQLAAKFDLPVSSGAWIQETTSGGPADAAGLKGGDRRERFQAQEYESGGDVITAVDGKPIRSESALGAAIAEKRPGETATLTVYRGGQRREVTVKLGERPLRLNPGLTP